MRKIGELKNEKDALNLWSYLKTENIETTLEKEEDKSWSIWVSEEDKVKVAQKELSEFVANPENKKYISVNKSVDLQSQVEENRTSTNKNSRFKEHNLRDRWSTRVKSPGTYTLSLIFTCIGVFLISGMGKNTEIVGQFFISEKFNGELTEFLSGQFWRIFTPIFLHFHIFHILFNMLWLFDLGSKIERNKGAKHFISFVLVVAAASNLTQYFISGPAFGGMSGVVYALFGYVWIKSKLDPGDGFYIDSFSSMFVFGWFFLCLTGSMGSIANWAHASGLIIGLGWGYLSALKWNWGSNK